jgi:arylesterase/paraoxonase
MRSLRHLTVALLFCISLAGCGASLPLIKKRTCSRIAVGPGTEDMVLDRSSDPPRLIISSHDRRRWASAGDIYEMNLKDLHPNKMIRLNEPQGLELRPQDLDIVKTERGDVLLYVVNHEKNQNGKHHSVLKYRVDHASLVFLEIIESELLTSPNGLRVFPDETFYVANDREDRSSIMTILFRLKRGTVYYYGKDRTFHPALSERLAYPNSIAMDDQHVYVTATLENQIYSFTRDQRGNLTAKERFFEMPSPDNAWIDNGYLYTQSHISSYKVFQHLKSTANKAPSVVARIRLKDKKLEYLYANDGSEFGAASVVLKYESSMYLGQIADSYVLKCDASDL